MLIFERASDRGEVRDDIDLDLLTPALPGIILHRLFLMGQPPTEDVITRVIDQVIIPAATRGTAPPPPTKKADTMTDVLATEEVAPGKQPKELHLGWALVLISIAQLMVVLDGTIVNIALPFIQADLNIATGEPDLGRHRLRTGLRKPAAARWSPR